MDLSKENQSAPNSDLTSNSMDFYKEICSNIRATDDISFKLLGIVPVLSGVGVGSLTFLEKNQSLATYSDFAVVAFSILGVLITVGLFKWELWNISKCRWLIARAADFERRFTIPEEPVSVEKIQWLGWEDAWKKKTIEPYSIFEGPWGKTQAEKFIYCVAIAAWFVPMMIVLFKYRINELIALVVDESKWLTASMGLALSTVAILFYRCRHSDVALRRRILAAMNLFFGVTIGTMTFGHLLAVTTKLATGTLRQGSIIVFYLIGIVLAVPSWWLIFHTRRILKGAQHDKDDGPTTIILNTWLAITLLALGVPNLPLAAPALLNIGYHLHSRRVVGWAIVSIAAVINVGLFIGSLIFLASGQSFEQLRGIE